MNDERGRMNDERQPTRRRFIVHPSSFIVAPRWFAPAFLALLLLACNGREKATPPSSAPPGDIILVTIDTWRADAAGFAGNARVQTPFLDSLAARGIVFTNAHAHNVITLPSHANILTGLNPYQHGVRENAGFVLDAKHTTVAERLREQGYATGAFVAAYPLDARFGLNQGFDVYDDNYGKGRASLDFSLQERPAPAVLQSAAKWWQSASGRKRFMWVHLYDPHAPYAPPEPFASTYRDRQYLGEVAAVDSALQTYLAPLMDDGTTVIVTADHGEALGDHGELTHGLFAYEATLKVPLIVAGPGAKPRREEQYVRHIDIVPTILERAGAAAVAELPGQSLLGRLEMRDTYFESLSASINRGWAPLTGLIRNGTKYIDLPLAELYDLPADPQELRNLYRERRRDVAAARQVLAGLDLAPKARRAVTAEEVARLRALGYVAGAPSNEKPTEADDPKNLVALDQKLHQVIDTYQRGDPAGALQIAREIVAEKPRMVAGRELLAFMLQQNERIPEALDVLGKLAAEGNASEASRVQLALLLTETGKAADAAALLAPMAKEGASAEILNGQGIALADEGRVQEAIAQFNRALEIDPNHAPALQNLGIVALRANDVRTAHDYLSRALALNPRLPLALNTMGVIYARQGDFPRAVDHWKRAVAVDPRQFDALYNIGLVQLRAGNRQDARLALERFARTAPPQRYANDIANARRALATLR
jgi:arylsulfatase A-like enzyme/Flp pilus assembly protein TadD